MSSKSFPYPVSRVSALAALAAFALMSVGVCSVAQAASEDFQSDPTLPYSDFHGLPRADGSGYRVNTSVPVSGYYGQFSLHTDDGDMTVDGASLLRQRIAEVGPTAALQKLSTSKVFADALGNSAKSGAEALGQAVSHPVDTVQKLPSGIGRFFKSVGASVKNVVSSSDDGDMGNATNEVLGINKAKRALAEKVGVDPYTTNPILSARLNQLAKAAVAGGVSLDVVLAVSTAGVATIVSATKTVSNLAWSLPPASVRERNDGHLAALGVDKAIRARLLDNRWFTPTMALSFVEAMERLDVREGADSFVALAAGAQSEIEARFYIAQLRMADSFAIEGHPIIGMEALGKVGGFRTGSEGLFVPVPLDYLTWSEGVSAFIQRKDSAARTRTAWFTGKVSPKAAAELRKAGWSVRADVTQH